MQDVEGLQWQAREITRTGGDMEELQVLSARIEAIQWNLEVGIPQLEFFEAKPMEDEYEAMVKTDIRVALEMREQ